MTTLDAWQAVWGLPDHAMVELRNILAAPSYVADADPVGVSEAVVQSNVMLEMVGERGGVGWRNNVGVAQSADGRPVRYGLANQSARVNARVKSSDLIGITPIRITPEMVGRLVGVFSAIECKRGAWRPGGDKRREEAQHKFHTIVRMAGGIAGFVSGQGQYEEIVKCWVNGI